MYGMITLVLIVEHIIDKIPLMNHPV